MGFTITVRNQQFGIHKDHFNVFLAICQEYGYKYISLGDSRGIKCNRWVFKLDDENNIVSINFHGDNRLDSYDFLNKFSRIVIPHSFIEILDDDSDIWRWVFLNGVMERKNSTISFN